MSDKDVEVQKDLGLKIGNKEESKWTEIKINQEATIRDCKINIKVAEVVLKLAEEQILIEKKNFRKL